MRPSFNFLVLMQLPVELGIFLLDPKSLAR